jgi:uncharacterized membrane protein (DUF2068 family)
METALPVSPRAHRLSGRTIIIIIGIFKLLKGCLMILAAVVAVELANPEVTRRVLDRINAFDFGPHFRLIGDWLTIRLLHLNIRTLVGVAVGAALYATVFFTEGAGLLLNKPWAEWMVVVSTSLLIPVEVGEIIGHWDRRPIIMVLTFIGNVAIAAYLVFHVRNRLRTDQESQRNSTGN